MAEIYEIDSEKFTQVEPTGEEEIQIGANKKTTLQAIADLHKDPTYDGLTLDSLVDGFEPLQTGGTQVESSFSLLQALQMLYRIGGNGSIKVVGNGLNKFGLVSIGDTTLAGILFNTSNNTVYIRDTTTVANSKQVTDLEIMNWLTDGTSIVLGATQEVNPADIKMTGFTKLNTTPSTLQSTEIQPTDSLLSVIQKLYLGITDNANIKLISSGRMIGVLIKDSLRDQLHGCVLELDGLRLYHNYGMDPQELCNKSDSQLIELIRWDEESFIDLLKVPTSVQERFYSTDNNQSVNLAGNDGKWYGGLNTNPRVTILVNKFDGTRQDAIFVCKNPITPTFVLDNSGSATINLHTELSNLPTIGDGFKVYTIYLQQGMGVNHFFVNGAAYE